jgi:hypothetical protein
MCAFADDSIPTPDRDAGSAAALTHIASLMRLGYQVHFVPSDNMARIPLYTDSLERMGVRCHYAPYQTSAEDVLRDHAGAFELIYLHRASNARYISLARARNPEAQILYNMADLHHLRLMREADVTGDARLLRHPQAIRKEELAAAEMADCTILHSTHEAAVLADEARRHLPAALARRCRGVNATPPRAANPCGVGDACTAQGITTVGAAGASGRRGETTAGAPMHASRLSRGNGAGCFAGRRSLPSLAMLKSQPNETACNTL